MHSDLLQSLHNDGSLVSRIVKELKALRHVRATQQVKQFFIVDLEQGHLDGKLNPTSSQLLEDLMQSTWNNPSKRILTEKDTSQDVSCKSASCCSINNFELASVFRRSLRFLYLLPCELFIRSSLPLHREGFSCTSLTIAENEWTNCSVMQR